MTHLDRDPRLVEVATLRARIFYTQLVDLQRGLPLWLSFRVIPCIPDPSLPPGAGVGANQVVQPTVTPETPAEESLKATTPKSKALPPQEPAPAATPGVKGEAALLPREGEKEEKVDKRNPSPASPKGSKEQNFEAKK